MPTDARWLSTSLIKEWSEGCPARAWEQHANRLQEGDSDEGEDHLLFGTIVHRTAERFHQLVMTEQASHSLSPTEVFLEEWKASNLSNEEYFSFGHDCIEEFLDRTLWNRRGETVATELFFVMDIEHQEIFLPDSPGEESVVLLAEKIRSKGGVPVVSKIDRVDRVEEEDGTITMEVYDYKTNRRPFSRDEVDESIQLAIYDMATRLVWPEANSVQCCFDMLRHGRFFAAFDEEHLERKRKFLLALWHQIQREKDPPERINSYCGFCTRRFRCSEYERVIMNPRRHLLLAPIQDRDEDESEEEYIERLWLEYERLRDAAKLMDQAAQEVKEPIMARMMKSGDPVRIGKKELYLKANPRYEYESDSVWVVFERHNSLSILKRAISISRPKLDSAIKGRVNLIEAVKPLLVTYFTKPTLTARTPKPETEEKTKK